MPHGTPRYHRQEYRAPTSGPAEYVGACLSPHPDDLRPCEKDAGHPPPHAATALDPVTGRIVTLEW